MICSSKRYNKLSLKLKLLMLMSGLMIGSIFVVSYIFYTKSYTQIEQLLKEKAMNIAKSASYLVDGDKLEQIELLGPKDEYYQELLNKFQALNQDVAQGMLYIIGNYGDLESSYIIDGRNTVHIGYRQHKKDFSEQAKLAFSRGESYCSQIYYVNILNKYYISTFVPVFNSQNEVVAIVAYDYEGSEISEKLHVITVSIIRVAVILVLCALIGNYIILKRVFRPMEYLVRDIGIIARGDMTVKLKIKHEDEIGKINRAVNNNVSKIRDILKKIKYSSEKVTLASKSILISSRDATEAYGELATSITGIAEMVQKQAEDTRESMILLEGLSDNGEHMYDQTQRVCKLVDQIKNNVEALEQCQSLSEIKSYINNIRAINSELIKEMNINEGYLQEVATHIAGIFPKLNKTEEVLNIIDINTVSLAAITQEQIATSQEFTAMAELLREQARALDESISKFII